MAAKYFYDVPVYRIPEEHYYREMNEHIEAFMFPGPPECDAQTRAFYSREPNHEIMMREHLRDQYGGAWKFNEIVGYIRLHFLGYQIRGEYWDVKKKRTVRSRTKILHYRTHKLAPEIDIPAEAENSEILELILEYLGDCSKELKGRFIDSSLLGMIGRHVNWKAILQDV